jgi:hypothetical protein
MIIETALPTADENSFIGQTRSRSLQSLSARERAFFQMPGNGASDNDPAAVDCSCVILTHRIGFGRIYCRTLQPENACPTPHRFCSSVTGRRCPACGSGWPGISSPWNGRGHSTKRVS